MKEMLQTVRSAVLIRIISRYGAVDENEAVTVTYVPKRGMYATIIGRDDIRLHPTPELLTGVFVITSRSRGKFTLQNQHNGVELSGVPRRSIRKILGWE